MRGPLTWLGFQLGLVALQIGWSLATLRLQQRLSVAAEIELRERLLGKCARLPYARLTEPDLLDRLGVLRRFSPLQSVGQLLFTVRAVVIFAGSLGLIASAGGWVVLAIVVASLPGLSAGTANAREDLASERELGSLARHAGYLEGLFFHEVAIREIKAFGAARFLVGRVTDVQRAAARLQLGHAFHTLARGQLAYLLGQAAYYAAYGLMAYRVVHGSATVGALTVFLAVFEGCRAAVSALLGSGATLYAQALRVRDYLDFLDEPEEPGAGDAAPDDAAGPLAPPSLELESVSFTYPGSNTPALRSVSLRVEPGQTMALVGRNGSGKTTLLKLLLGLYRPSEGRILLDGRDIATLGAADLRRRLAVAFQDFVRFEMTVEENVALGWTPPGADRGAVGRALSEAGADTVVAALPAGTGTLLGTRLGGTDLSAGQWQRIAVARALLRPAGLLVLDEATAAADPEAEAALLARLAASPRRRTTVLVTQRPGPLQHADLIVVLDGGRVAESGDHESLVRRGGLYRHLFAEPAA